MRDKSIESLEKQRDKDINNAIKEQHREIKHLETRLPIVLESFSSLFDEWTDNQRIEVIKSLIWTAPNAQSFAQKVAKLLNSKRFQEKID